MIVIDASVWIGMFLTTDPFHSESDSWFHAWQMAGNSTVVPGHFLAEVAGAVARLSLDQAEGLRAINTVHPDPLISVIAISEQLAYQSADLASTLRLKGADAIYVALAQHLHVPLVTWDNEQLQRAGQLITVITPAQALETLA